MNELFFVRWHSAWGSTPSPTKAFLDNPDSPHLCSPHLTSRPTYRGPKGSNLFRKFLRVFVKYRSKPPPPNRKPHFYLFFGVIWAKVAPGGQNSATSAMSSAAVPGRGRPPTRWSTPCSCRGSRTATPCSRPCWRTRTPPARARPTPPCLPL